MYSLLKKEIASFFASVTGYLVIGVFLALTGLFLWVIPGNFNILYGGYSSLDSLFYLAPWLYLFLVPAVTMRLFSEEVRSGTIELLFTRPISTFNIVLAKYLAALFIVVLSLLPTLIYYASVYYLGNPQGNIDVGGTNGSYLGLFFLASIYVAIGVFSSAITQNQIVAFIVAVLLCFVFYFGFDSIAEISGSNTVKNFVVNLGVDTHYESISRGVVDSRDLIYFLSVIFVFLFSTRTILSKSK